MILSVAVLEIFAEAAELPDQTPRYRWPLWQKWVKPVNTRRRAERREVAKVKAKATARRLYAEAKATRVSHATETLPFAMSCRFCRLGCHHAGHFYACPEARGHV